MSAAAEAVARATAAGLTVATAESLTAGLLAAALADVPGASAVLQGGVVAYQNRVKHALLGVDEGLLADRGAVDPATARQMAAGARARVGADVGLSTTGVAGPEPHQGRPVGTVYVGLSVGPALVGVLGELADDPRLEVSGTEAALALHVPGARPAVRAGTVDEALGLLLRVLP